MRTLPVSVVAGSGTSHLFNLEWSPTMIRINFRNAIRNALGATLLMGGPIVATSALAQSQGGSGMMGGYGANWMGGGYGGIWLPILLVVVVAGFVAWIVAQKRK